MICFNFLSSKWS